MSLFAVQYTYADNTAELDAHRPEHRAFLGRLADRGMVLLSGPLAAGVGQPSTALILVEADEPQQILDALTDDPFQQRGLVESVEVRGWTPVLGAWHEQLGL